MYKSIFHKIAFLPIAAFLFGSLLTIQSQTVSAQQYKKITRLGTSQSMCSGGVETLAQLKEYVADNPGAIRSVLADSGWGGNADDFLAAIAEGDIVERAYPSGSQFAWMGAKVGGRYVAKPYREWAGSRSFEAFQVNVVSGCQVYHIAIPKDCCNISLVSTAPDNSSECQAPIAAIPAAPAAPVEAKKALGLIPFLGLFTGSETRPRYEPAWDMDMVDSSGITGVRAGLLKPLSAKTSFFGQLAYYDRNGINEFNVYPEDNISIDIGLERKLSEHAFIGGGVGVWNVDDSDFSDATLFGHVGGDIGKSNFQWILEGRLFDSDSDNHDSVSDNKMVSAGIRYLFK